MAWQLQDAENRLSELVQKALHEGPQEVTVPENQAVVVVARDEYERLKGQIPGSKSGFVDALLSGPAWDDELVEWINDRPKWTPREIDF